MTDNNTKLIHIAKIFPKGGIRFLFLREKTPTEYTWFLENQNKEEVDTNITATTIHEALRLGQKNWKKDYLTLLHCGFRYTLPERDEHGTNALFFQMAASYQSPNGIYFDQELGFNCIVHQASLEARQFLNQKS